MKTPSKIIISLLLCASFSIFANTDKSNFGLSIAGLNGSACSFNTIVDAIAAAQPNDTVNIREGTYNELLGEISKDLRLVASRGGPGQTGCEIGFDAEVTINGSGQSFDANGGLAKITNASRVTFININLTNASAVNGGIMAISGGSSVLLNNSNVSNGSALSAGGNIYVTSETNEEVSQLILTNGSAIYGGTVVSGDGGGVALYDSTLLITEGSIGLLNENEGNMASNNGGGVYAENSNVTINSFNSQIQNNQSDNFGGGIFVSDSTLEINDSTINDNTVNFNGGGIYSDSSDISINDARLENNETTGFSGNVGGGGLYLIGPGEVVVNGSTIISNTARVVGGGILNIDNKTMLSIINGSDIVNNSAVSGGGVLTESPLTIQSSNIRFNSSSTTGGGIRCVSCQSLLISDASQIANNQADQSGGGIYTTSNNVTRVEIMDSSITANSVLDSSISLGGGIYQENGLILIENSTISSNVASSSGGGVFLFDMSKNSDDVNIINSQFFNNSTNSDDERMGGAALFLSEISDAKILGSNFNNNISARNGGAIQIYMSNVIIDESIVTQNDAGFEGGGIFVEENSNILIKNSEITQNENFDTFVVVSGIYGGGGIKSINSNLSIINTKINENISHDMGGGIFFEGNMNNALSITSDYGNVSGQCLPSELQANEYCSEISSNNAIFGTAIMVSGVTSDQGINLNGLALNNNQTISFGPPPPTDPASVIQFDLENIDGDIEVTMENLIMTENVGFFDEMPLIKVNGNSIVELNSSTVASNTGKPIQMDEDGATLIVQNSILQQNTAGSFVGNDVSFISLCNNSEPAEIGGQSFGIDLGDPQFFSNSRGDYRLAANSPSIDRCSFGSLIDIDGNTRPNDSENYDQGAFEMDAEFFLDLIFESGMEAMPL
ncbi:MAG: hypothetical protein AB8B80_01830 [Marinicellaceae bacterium]